MENFHSVQILVTACFVLGIFWLEKKDNDKITFLIISLNFAIEAIVSIALTADVDQIGIFYTFYAIGHNCLWLLLISHIFKIKVVKVLLPYLLFCLFNLLFFEGFYEYNTYSFVIGGLIYITIFIYQSFKILQFEKLQFFSGLQYFLLFIPVPYFLGLSFYFGFKDSSLGDIKLIGDIDLYKFVMNFVDVIYYGLLIIYIIKRKRDGK